MRPTLFREFRVRPGQDQRDSPLAPDKWVSVNREFAISGIAPVQATGVVELGFRLAQPKAFTHFELNDAARKAPIHTFGWPIGVYLEREEYRPRPKKHGIVAELPWTERHTYDYWAISLHGTFYQLSTYSEDALGRPDIFAFDTRIVRTAEFLLYCDRLYTALGVPAGAVVDIVVRYEGLTKRRLGAVGRRRVDEPKQSREDDSLDGISIKHGTIPELLPDLTRKLCDPVFVLFDFFRVEPATYTEIVTRFMAGEVD